MLIEFSLKLFTEQKDPDIIKTYLLGGRGGGGGGLHGGLVMFLRIFLATVLRYVLVDFIQAQLFCW